MEYILKAEARTLGTAGELKALRKSNRVPIAVYGKGIPTQHLVVNNLEFTRVMKAAGESSLITLEVAGKPAINVLLKEVQLHPVKDTILHGDLYQIDMNVEVEAEVKLVFVGEAPAVKEKGGNLVTTMDHLKIKCLPKDLPHEISIDLTTLVEFGDNITVGSLTLPSGVKVEDDPSATIASVAAVKEEKLDATAAPEVVIAEAQKQGPEVPVSTADDKQTGDKGGKKEEKK